MAKTKGPLLSLDAHGSVADLLTYSHRKSGRQVRTYTKPLVAASAKQRGQRRLTEFLVAQWQNMSAGDKATWEANAAKSNLNLEGYHYFLREAQRDLYTHTGLCGYWHCNEIVGGKVLDLSGNANHGTLEPGYPANAPVLVDSYKTKFSKALLYDGVDEYIELPVSAKLDEVVAVNLWLNSRSFATFQGVIDYYKANNSAWTLAQVNGFNFPMCFRRSDAATVESDINNLNDKKWHDVWFLWDGNRTRIFIDTVMQADNHAGNFFADGNGGTLRIGVYWFNDVFDKPYGGWLDEICLYKRAPSAAEILTRYKFATREVD